MIKIQNDSLVLAQDELKLLQNKVYELEADREIKIQEIKNLRQALSLNQNSIEELKISLRNSEEKGNNTQQTVIFSCLVVLTLHTYKAFLFYFNVKIMILNC